MLSPQDELAYERNWNDADPLNLGCEQRDPFAFADLPDHEIERMSREHNEYLLAEAERKRVFYADQITKPRYRHFVEINDRGYASAIRRALTQIEEAYAAGDGMAAEAGAYHLEMEFGGLEDRISDLASDY